MINIDGINISDKTITLFEFFSKFSDWTYSPRQKLIEDIFLSLCEDNGMNLDLNGKFIFNSPFETRDGGAWNRANNTISIFYDNSSPEINQIIATICHEFRHMWQYYHNNKDFDNLMKDNLIGGFDDSYEEYRLQPIEQDAYNFEFKMLSFLYKEFEKDNLCNSRDDNVEAYIELYYDETCKQDQEIARMFRLTHDINRLDDFIKYDIKCFEQSKKNDVFNLTRNGYVPTNKYFETAIGFAKDTNVVDMENPEYLFKYEKYNIAATISGDKFNYCIYYPVQLERNEYILDDAFSGEKYTMFFGNCSINACVSEFVFPSKNLDCQEFNNLLELNEELVKFYNIHFDKNIDKITFNPKFWNRNKKEYNLLFKKSKYKSNIFERLNGLPKGTFKLNLAGESKLENIILKTKDNNNFKSIINKITDNRSEDISNLEFNMLRSRYSNIETTIDDVKHNFSELSNDDILKVFKRQIDNFSDINKILDDKNISNTIAEQIRFMNSSDLDTELKNKTSVVDRNNDIEIDEDKTR